MRGKERQPKSVEHQQGITPAYAGKSRRHLLINRLRGDHPRMCGEKGGQDVYLIYPAGSPPRMRGKETRQAGLLRAAGITPACAGKSEKTALTTMCRRDHPRMCGEKPLFMYAGFPTWGSPPHVRGKAKLLHCQISSTRITPAYAGKRSSSKAGPVGLADHPRVCGEKFLASTFFAVTLGSPPHMRGKVQVQTGLPPL